MKSNFDNSLFYSFFLYLSLSLLILLCFFSLFHNNPNHQHRRKQHHPSEKMSYNITIVIFVISAFTCKHSDASCYAEIVRLPKITQYSGTYESNSTLMKADFSKSFKDLQCCDSIEIQYRNVKPKSELKIVKDEVKWLQRYNIKHIDIPAVTIGETYNCWLVARYTYSIFNLKAEVRSSKMTFTPRQRYIIPKKVSVSVSFKNKNKKFIKIDPIIQKQQEENRQRIIKNLFQPNVIYLSIAAFIIILLTIIFTLLLIYKKVKYRRRRT